jgi:hypothetical protein
MLFGETDRADNGAELERLDSIDDERAWDVGIEPFLLYLSDAVFVAGAVAVAVDDAST